MGKIFIDFDGVLVRSLPKLVDVLNTRYNRNVDWREVKKYNLSDKFSVEISEILEIFDDEFFINLSQYFMLNVQNVLTELAKDNELCVVTIGTLKNTSLKSQWMRMFPQITKGIFLSMTNVKMDKSVVDMGSGIFIDDCLSNLISSNAKYKILFSEDGVRNEWNNNLKNEEGYFICKNWDEVLETVNLIKGGLL